MRKAFTRPTLKVRPLCLVQRMTPLYSLMKRSGSPSEWRLPEVFMTRSKLAIVSPSAEVVWDLQDVSRRGTGGISRLAGGVTYGVLLSCSPARPEPRL